jgi:capsular polysaccharide biosynthesis protein
VPELGEDHVDIWGAITVLVRRYYLTLPIAAIALVLGWSYASGIAPEYHASATIVIVGPTAVATKDAPQPTNPFQALGTATIAAAIQIDASSANSKQQLLKAGDSTNVSVAAVTRTPIMNITATSATPARAAATVTRLISIIQADLAARQRPYDPNVANQVTAQVLQPAQLAAADVSSKHKTQAVAVAVSVVLAVLLTLLIDGMLASRSRGRGRNASSFEPADFEDDGAVRRTSVVKS